MEVHRYSVVVFCFVFFKCFVWFFLLFLLLFFFKPVFSFTPSVKNLDAIIGGKAQDSAAGFGKAPGSL